MGDKFCGRRRPLSHPEPGPGQYPPSLQHRGGANWFPETANYYYGGSAAQSGAIDGINQWSQFQLQTTVVGPGNAVVLVEGSCEQRTGKFMIIWIFMLMTRTRYWIGGEVDWTQEP